MSNLTSPNSSPNLATQLIHLVSNWEPSGTAGAADKQKALEIIRHQAESSSAASSFGAPSNVRVTSIMGSSRHVMVEYSALWDTWRFPARQLRGSDRLQELPFSFLEGDDTAPVWEVADSSLLTVVVYHEDDGLPPVVDLVFVTRLPDESLQPTANLEVFPWDNLPALLPEHPGVVSSACAFLSNDRSVSTEVVIAIASREGLLVEWRNGRWALPRREVGDLSFRERAYRMLEEETIFVPDLLATECIQITSIPNELADGTWTDDDVALCIAVVPDARTIPLRGDLRFRAWSDLDEQCIGDGAALSVAQAVATSVEPMPGTRVPVFYIPFA